MIIRHYRLPGMAVAEHTFEVPLDHSASRPGSISLFALELSDPARRSDSLPWLAFFQGGPGMAAPRPLRGSAGWLSRALRTHRVLLIDQRGTGRSTPLTPHGAATMSSPEELARYIALMRADSIVADSECIRRELCGDEQWETLGQSYGGRVTLTYLCQAPEGLRACYVAGGLAGIDADAFDVYTRTIPRVREKVLAYYETFPADMETVKRLRDRLSVGRVSLPNGDTLSVARMRQIGRLLGFGDGPARLHWMLADAIDAGGAITDAFLAAVQDLTSYPSPLYPLLQDVCKAQGRGATDWAARRAMSLFPEFAPDADPVLLTGEFTFPWLFEETAGLRPFAGAAQMLAEREEWPVLWTREQLVRNQVDLAAVIYRDDIFIDADHSIASAEIIGSATHWETAEWEHDGLNASGGQVLDHLMAMSGEGTYRSEQSSRRRESI